MRVGIAALVALVVGACAESSALPSSPPQKNFEWVFFEIGSALLSAPELMKLDSFAIDARARGGRLCITAHADRSGPPAYNMELSQRRAETVRNELVRRGMPTESLEIRWRGETQPMVTPQDGAHERQNRRADILWC